MKLPHPVFVFLNCFFSVSYFLLEFYEYCSTVVYHLFDLNYMNTRGYQNDDDLKSQKKKKKNELKGKKKKKS